MIMLTRLGVRVKKEGKGEAVLETSVKEIGDLGDPEVDPALETNVTEPVLEIEIATEKRKKEKLRRTERGKNAVCLLSKKKT